jgi:hypothetical protein
VAHGIGAANRQMATPLACLLFSRVAVSDPELGDGGKGRADAGKQRRRKETTRWSWQMCWSLLAPGLQFGRAIVGGRTGGWLLPLNCLAACRRTGGAGVFPRRQEPPMVFSFFSRRSSRSLHVPPLFGVWTPRVEVSQLDEAC